MSKLAFLLPIILILGCDQRIAPPNRVNQADAAIPPGNKQLSAAPQPPPTIQTSATLSASKQDPEALLPKNVTLEQAINNYYEDTAARSAQVPDEEQLRFSVGLFEYMKNNNIKSPMNGECILNYFGLQAGQEALNKLSTQNLLIVEQMKEMDEHPEQTKMAAIGYAIAQYQNMEAARRAEAVPGNPNSQAMRRATKEFQGVPAESNNNP